MKKRELCYVCAREVETKSSHILRPARFFFLTTMDYREHDPGFDANNPPEYTDLKNAVACCNEHVEDLKALFFDEEIRQVTYEEWIVNSVMVT